MYENINQSELRIEFGDYIFNTKTQDLKINNNEIYLTEGEHNLLQKLINKRNQLVSREELDDEEWNKSVQNRLEGRAIAKIVNNIRKANISETFEEYETLS